VGWAQLVSFDEMHTRRDAGLSGCDAVIDFRLYYCLLCASVPRLLIIHQRATELCRVRQSP